MADLEEDLDYGDFVNVSKQNVDEDEELGYRILWAVEVSVWTVDSVLLIASALFAAVLLLVMIKFKLYKKNVLIFNFCLAEIVGNVAGAIYVILLLCGWFTATLFEVISSCLLTSVSYWTRILSLYSMWSTGLLWFLEIIKPEWFQKYPKIPLYVLGFIHLGGTTIMRMLSIDCFEGYGYLPREQLSLLRIIFYFAALVVIIGINIAACGKQVNNLQLSTKYHLTGATYVVLSHFPLHVLMLFNFFVRISYKHPIFTIYLIVIFICEYICVISVIVVTFLLRKYSVDFKNGLL